MREGCQTKGDNMMYSKLYLAIAMLGACSDEPGTDTTDQGVDQAVDGASARSTRIKVNGRSADVLLNTSTVNGFLNVSRDQLANTTALDFAYQVTDANADTQTLIQGSGAIPNSAFAIGTTTATLNVTTTFVVNRCVVNQTTGATTCDTNPAVAFNLAWTADGAQTIAQKLQQVITQGPTKTTVKGDLEQASAGISGAFGGFTAVDNPGNLIDTKSNTVTRDIDFRP